jgi:hypothetical protein
LAKPFSRLTQERVFDSQVNAGASHPDTLKSLKAMELAAKESMRRMAAPVAAPGPKASDGWANLSNFAPFGHEEASAPKIAVAVAVAITVSVVAFRWFRSK